MPNAMYPEKLRDKTALADSSGHQNFLAMASGMNPGFWRADPIGLDWIEVGQILRREGGGFAQPLTSPKFGTKFRPIDAQRSLCRLSPTSSPSPT
jgi:hypothetical protein